MSTLAPSISVVVPTYDRAAELTRCLLGIAAQERPPEEVIVVLRHEDPASEAVLRCSAARFPLRIARVDRPGLVQALNAGLDAASSDIVAFTDDDAVPRPEWLALVETHFTTAVDVAAVGGRDVVHHGDRIDDQSRAFARRLRLGGARTPAVGRVQRVGRVTGNHHLASGHAREVDVLKGVNMAYRRELLVSLRFDESVRGTGSQVHNELSVCLPLRAAGWRIVFDPAAAVDHYPAVRQQGDHRELWDASTVSDQTFNEELSVWGHLPRRWRLPHLTWATVIGTRRSPGLAQLPRVMRHGDPGFELVATTFRARRAARRVLRTRAPRRAVPPGPAS